MVTTKNTKVLGSSTLALTLLLNGALIGFAVYLHKSARRLFLYYIVTDSVVGISSAIAACVGLAGFLNYSLSALSVEFYHAIFSIVFSIGLSTLHIIAAQHLKKGLKDYAGIYNCFYTTASAFGLLAIANAYIAVLICSFIKEEKLEGKGHSKIKGNENDDKLYKTCNLDDTTYSTRV